MDSPNLWSTNPRSKNILRLADILAMRDGEGDTPKPSKPTRRPHLNSNPDFSACLMYSLPVTIETRDPFSNDCFSTAKGTLAISETKPMVQFCLCLFAENNKTPLCMVDLTPGFRFTVTTKIMLQPTTDCSQMKTHDNNFEGSFYFGQQIWATIFESNAEADMFMLYLSIARFCSSFCDDIIFQDVSCISFNTQSRATVGDQLEIQFDVWQVPTNQLKATCGSRFVTNGTATVDLYEGQTNGLNKGLIGMPDGGSRIIVIPPHLIHKAPLFQGVSNSHITMPVAVFVKRMHLKRSKRPRPSKLDEYVKGSFSSSETMEAEPLLPHFDLEESYDSFDDGYTYRLMMMELEDLQMERDNLNLQISRMKTQAELDNQEKQNLNQRYATLFHDFQRVNGDNLNSMSYSELDKLEEHLLAVIRKLHFEKERKRTLSSLEPDCTICMDRKSTSVCVPCGHYCLCDGCSIEMTKQSVLARCPICRQIIQQVVKVYK